MFFAICHGAALPVAMYIFGDLTNFFVNHDITRQIFDDVNSNVSAVYVGVTFNDSAGLDTVAEAIESGVVSPNVLDTFDEVLEYFTLFFINDLNRNLTETEETGAFIIACVINNSAQDDGQSVFDYVRTSIENNALTIAPTSSACDQCLDDLFTDFSTQARCLSNDDFLYGEGGVDGILWQIYLFIIIAVAVFICGYFQISLIQLACERQVHKMRKLYYKSVLYQDVGWFDLNPSGELASRLNE